MTERAEKPNLPKAILSAVVGVGAAVSLAGQFFDVFPNRITAPTAPPIQQNCWMACAAKASLDGGIVAGAQVAAMGYNSTVEAFERPIPKGWWKPPPEFNNTFPNHTRASKVAINLGLTMMGIGWVASGLSGLGRSSGQSNPSNNGGDGENDLSQFGRDRDR